MSTVRQLARTRRFSELLQSRATAWVILAVSLALTAAAWYVARQAVHGSTADRFEYQTEEIENAIRDKTNVYEQVLWGSAGLFNASSEVSRDEWNKYVSSLDLAKNWPGVQAMGFVTRLDPEEVAEHVAAVRSEGFANYTIQPEGPREEYSSIVFLEPYDPINEQVMGFDLLSYPIAETAMTQASDSGLAATLGAIDLVPDPDGDDQRGFLTFAPVYETKSIPEQEIERQQNVQGWVFAAFKMGDLMNGILTSNSGDIDFEIFDGDDASLEQLLFDSDGGFAGDQPPPDSDFHSTKFVELQGQEWMIVFSSGDNFLSSSEANSPTLIAVIALIFNGFLFFVIKTLGASHRRERDGKDLLKIRSDELEEHTARLEQSNGDLEKFAHIASHDLQEPLRNLGSYASLLSDNYKDKLGEEGDRWLGYIAESSQRMSGLLRDVLNYASMEGEDEPLTTVDLDKVLNIVLDDFAQVIDAEGIVIDRQRLPVVEGDIVQLGRLFQNLVGNAIKYKSDTGQHRVSIGVSERGTDWRFSVRDNGIGIKPEYHERVFEVFRRVAPRSKYAGTGIGLSVCHKVIQRHGGTIGVDSVPGQGSDFWFTLPQVQPVAHVSSRASDKAMADA